MSVLPSVKRDRDGYFSYVVQITRIVNVTYEKDIAFTNKF
jgi:hypothetical protein